MRHRKIGKVRPGSKPLHQLHQFQSPPKLCFQPPTSSLLVLSWTLLSQLTLRRLTTNWHQKITKPSLAESLPRASIIVHQRSWEKAGMGLEARIRSECQAGRDKQCTARPITRLSQETRELPSDVKSSRGFGGVFFGDRGRFPSSGQTPSSTRPHIHL